MTKSASGSIVKKSVVGPGMTKSASGNEIKCLTEIKETISTEMAVVTTAQGKVVAITYLSIRLRFMLSKKGGIVPLSPSIHFFSIPHPPLQKEKLR